MYRQNIVQLSSSPQPLVLPCITVPRSQGKGWATTLPSLLHGAPLRTCRIRSQLDIKHEVVGINILLSNGIVVTSVKPNARRLPLEATTTAAFAAAHTTFTGGTHKIGCTCLIHSLISLNKIVLFMRRLIVMLFHVGANGLLLFELSERGWKCVPHPLPNDNWNYCVDNAEVFIVIFYQQKAHQRRFAQLNSK